MKNWIKAFESGWRAGLRQFRRMRTLQRKVHPPLMGEPF